MLNLLESFKNLIIRHRLIVLVFLFILFRPQILFAIRKEIIRPLVQLIGPHHQVRKPVCQPASKPVKASVWSWDDSDEEDGCSDEDDSCEDTGDSEYYDSDSDEDDGCSDDEGCESESEYYEEDESSDDGCSDEDDSCSDDSGEDEDDDYEDDGCGDDGGCESGNSYDSGEDEYYDDGCSCQGETVVTSDPDQNNGYYFNELKIRINGSGTARHWKLYITDNQGYLVRTIVENAQFASGPYYYSWNGYDQRNYMITEGTYYLNLENDGVPRQILRAAFSYTVQHGFEASHENNEIILTPNL